jgi:hypothetical protein
MLGSTFVAVCCTACGGSQPPASGLEAAVARCSAQLTVPATSGSGKSSAPLRLDVSRSASGSRTRIAYLAVVARELDAAAKRGDTLDLGLASGSASEMDRPLDGVALFSTEFDSDAARAEVSGMRRTVCATVSTAGGRGSDVIGLWADGVRSARQHGERALYVLSDCENATPGAKITPRDLRAAHTVAGALRVAHRLVRGIALPSAQGITSHLIGCGVSDAGPLPPVQQDALDRVWVAIGKLEDGRIEFDGLDLGPSAA